MIKSKQVRFQLEPPQSSGRPENSNEKSNKLLPEPVQTPYSIPAPVSPSPKVNLPPIVHKSTPSTPTIRHLRPRLLKKTTSVILLAPNEKSASKMPPKPTQIQLPNTLQLPEDGIRRRSARKLNSTSIYHSDTARKPDVPELTGALMRWRADRKVSRARSHWTEVSATTTPGSSYCTPSRTSTSPSSSSTSSLAAPASVRTQLLKRSDGTGTRTDIRMPEVTTLLRASREADEDLLLSVLKEISENGITRDALNEEDCGGRTALSYICSTNLTHILDAFLQIPGLDINKADLEGNGPLHYAAQAGQSDIINILLTRSRSIEIDARNRLGFTPLMKAALQGRTRCAKLLLFAGASSQQTDNGRKFRAEQWARFCGRNSCADMIEKCAKVRILEQPPAKLDAAKDKKQITRTLTTPVTLPSSKMSPSAPGNGIRSKLRRVFNFSLKESSKNKSQLSGKHELAFYASDDINVHDTHLSKGYTIPFEVPKLHVTPVSFITPPQKPALKEPPGDTTTTTESANNAKNISQVPPAVPPRSRIRSSH